LLFSLSRFGVQHESSVLCPISSREDNRNPCQSFQ
jgi:hypothetical protein